MNKSIFISRNLLLSALFLLCATFCSAQYALPEGGKQINAGFGASSWGTPVYVGLDFGVHPDISVGGELSFRSYRQTYFGEKYSSSIIGLGANANYHFNHILDIPTKWDLYAGVTVGFYIWNSSANYVGDGASGLGFSGQAGARYYFNDKWAVNVEFGGGTVSGGRFGVTKKF
jgi:outer membrane immunogenic protein